MSIEQFKRAMKQELLTKHAKFFAADKKFAMKQFQGIRYESNGTAYVSDTSILLRVKDASPFSEPHTLHAITGAELEGVYPSNGCENYFDYVPENRIVLEIREQIEAVTVYAKIAQMVEKELSPKSKIMYLELTLKGAYFKVEDQGVELKMLIGYPESSQEETWTFNADYVYNAMNLFKCAGTRELVIKLKNSYAPIILSDEENGIDVLILPIRTNAEVRDECS